MIVKFHKRGSGHGRGPVQYLLGKDFNRDGARLLRGDAQQMIDVINSLNFARTYTSGVLSFEEENISNELKQQLMTDFENTLLPAVADDCEILWIEHRDKNRLELNFVIANVHLATAKRLQPYYHAADFRRVAAWQNLMNGTHNFSDPNDPAKKRFVSPATAFADRANAVEMINNSLLKLVRAGEVSSRDDVKAALLSAGFSIARETKKSLSISAPGETKNIRLRGKLYEQQFNFESSAAVREEIERASSAYRESAASRAEKHRAELAEAIRIKRAANLEQYRQQRADTSAAHRSVAKTAPGSAETLNDAHNAVKRSNDSADRAVVAVARASDVRRIQSSESAKTSAYRKWRQLHRAGHDENESKENREQQQLHTSTSAAGAVENDRARASIIERVKSAVAATRTAASSFIANAKTAIAKFRDTTTRKRTNETAHQQLIESSRSIQRASRTYQQLAERLSNDNDRSNLSTPGMY